jgi:beta-N-acetylhexosaminidase
VNLCGNLETGVFERRSFLKGVGATLLSSLGPVKIARASDNDVEALVARTFIVGFEGNDTDDPEFKALLSLIQQGPLGGVIYLARNIAGDANVLRMNAALRSAAAEPLFISVDEEGGSVRRLRRLRSVPNTPSARHVAQMDPEESLELYAEMAQAVARLGFNLNYGPVLDLAVNKNSAVISRLGRSYGREPELVAAHASSFIGAHHSFGVQTAIKHFPGHGSVSADPHDVPVDASSSWSPAELEPFRLVLAQERPLFLMTSHQVISHPLLKTSPGVPITFSPEAVAFVRQELGFQRLVVSDDLMMGAIAARHSPEEAVIKALLAGHDCVILAEIGRNAVPRIRQIITAVAQAAQRSPQLLERLIQANTRIRKAKAAL